MKPSSILALPSLVGVAAGVSTVTVLSSVIAVYVIMTDINSFYDQTLSDMAEFKMYANDAWSEMVQVTTFASPIQSKREKRQGACNCGPQSRYCSPGPPGPPGSPGERGFDGEQGFPGRDGLQGIMVSYARSPSACLSCPMGPPGFPGREGGMGERGQDGYPGEPGFPGKDGEPGQQGSQGEQGRPGTRGENGRPGRVGENGVRGRGTPGARGQPGPMGQVGLPGNAGQPGRTGSPGPQGQPGTRGQKGYDAPPGQTGSPGLPGPPGIDAAYCSCPQRSSELALEVATVAYQQPTSHSPQGFLYQPQSEAFFTGVDGDYRKKKIYKERRAHHH